MSAPADASFEALVEFLRTSRGFDFTGYKRTSLERRVRRRMDDVGYTSFGDYVDYLEVHPEEFELLFNTILINVTEFFRDPPAWQRLSSLLPSLLDGHPADAPVRVWSAGCATGQEAYTLAMVLAEELGTEAYRERVKIYATDIDEDALAVARLGVYEPDALDGVPEELRARYFQPAGDALAFRKDLRRTVIFGRNNLVGDAPISRLELLVCRNTLMYLNAETQDRIVRHFHFALRDGGILMLGRSEMMSTTRGLFVAEDLGTRIFRKAMTTAPLEARVVRLVTEDDAMPALELDDAARDAALEAAPQALLLVSPDGRIAYANALARALFALDDGAIGRRLSDEPIGKEPVDLPGPVERALAEGDRIALGDVAHTPPDGQPRRLSVTVTPLIARERPPLGVSVVFEDVTSYTSLQDELDHSRRDLEAAYGELESTIDELETTNEELQSANEELQTTNEELQSTNEELETMNEELQSTNEELETLNDELRQRTSELHGVNEFLEMILTSLGIGVAVVDPDGRVQIWNRGAEELWGLRSDEAVEDHFLSLDIGLDAPRLAPELRATLTQGAHHRMTLDAVNRRGRPIRCDVSLLPLVSVGAGNGHVRGAIVLMEDEGAEAGGRHSASDDGG